MKVDQRERTVTHKYIVYIAKYGKQFESKDQCENHEKILDGTRKVCECCGGKGGWQGKYIKPYRHWDGDMGGYHEWIKCERCDGKGYLDKKVTWE